MGMLGNSAGGGTSFNPAAPGPIGGSTPAAITGTTITASTKFLAPDGSSGAPAYSFSSTSTVGAYYHAGTNSIRIKDGWGGEVGIGNGGASIISCGQIRPTSAFINNNARLFADAADIFAQYNSTSAQEYQLYGTRTDASNYERLALRTAAGSYTITPEAAGTGTLRGLILGAASTSIGFFGVTPAARAAAYTPTNVTTDRSFDANASSTAELADVLGTLIADLQAYGLLQ